MLIQNISSLATAPAPLASNGGPAGVVAQPAAATEAPQANTQQPSAAQLAAEVGKINRSLQQANRNVELSLSVDKDTHRPIVKLLDKETGDTILQYPNESVLAISRGIDEFQQASLLKQKA